MRTRQEISNPLAPIRTALDLLRAALAAGLETSRGAIEAAHHSLEVTLPPEHEGISAELLPQVFDMFAQADRARSGSGLGVGLTLVQRLVELHGGEVQACSAGAGQGSEFIVRLPLRG